MDDDTNLNLAEEKKAELKVKISMLKHNLLEFRREVEKSYV